MKLTKNFSKNIVLTLFVPALLISAILFSSPPAFSAPENSELLKNYVGDWRGSGKLNQDGNSETLRCKLNVTDREGGKVGYKGRCAIAGASFSITGTIGFIEKKKRFEAVMSSNTSFSGVAIGKRKGAGIDFQLKDRNAETGDKFEIKSKIELNGETIEVGFTIINITTNQIISANIPFEK